MPTSLLEVQHEASQEGSVQSSSTSSFCKEVESRDEGYFGSDLERNMPWLKLATRGKLVIRVISSQCTGAYETKKNFFWRPYGHLYENLHLLKFPTIQYFTLPLLNVAHNCCPLLHSRYVCMLPLSFLAVCHNHHYSGLPLAVFKLYKKITYCLRTAHSYHVKWQSPKNTLHKLHYSWLCCNYLVPH